MATSPHPPSPLQLPEEGLKGRVELKFFDGFNRGVACKLDSIGYKAMVEAFTQVDGAPHTLQAGNGKVMVIASRIACYCGPVTVACMSRGSGGGRLLLLFHASPPDCPLKVYGSCAPFSITGSLPCIRELQVWRAWQSKLALDHSGCDIQRLLSVYLPAG